MEHLRPSQQQYINTAVEIQRDRAGGIPTYMPKAFALANLPHKDPKSPLWHRENGRLSIRLQARLLETDQATGDVKHTGIPYGVYPRLMLYHVARQVLLADSRDICLGESLSGFLRQIGVKHTGGKNGTATAVKRQIQRLFSCRISIEDSREHGDVIRQQSDDMLLAESSVYFWDVSDADNFFNGHITLTDAFYQTLRQSCIPVDLRPLMVPTIRDSPLCLDLLAWLSYEVQRATSTGKTHSVPWRALERQMGSTYKQHRDFKRYALKQLRTIMGVYLDWQSYVDYSGDRLIIYPGGQPTILNRSTHYVPSHYPTPDNDNRPAQKDADIEDVAVDVMHLNYPEVVRKAAQQQRDITEQLNLGLDS